MKDILLQHGIGGGGSNIKSIQRGVTSIPSGTSINIAISTVNLNNTILLFNTSMSANVSASLGNAAVKGALTTSTNVEFKINSFASVYTPNVRISWTVIEFNNVKSVQRGDLVFTTAVSTDVTISPVDISKSMSLVSAMSSNLDYTYYGEGIIGIEITSPTKIAITGGGGSSKTKTAHWQVIEFN